MWCPTGIYFIPNSYQFVCVSMVCCIYLRQVCGQIRTSYIKTKKNLSLWSKT